MNSFQPKPEGAPPEDERPDDPPAHDTICDDPPAQPRIETEPMPHPNRRHRNAEIDFKGEAFERRTCLDHGPGGTALQEIRRHVCCTVRHGAWLDGDGHGLSVQGDLTPC